MPNPTSISTINSMSTSSLPEEQLLSHSITSATTAGSSSGGEPGSFSPPPGPSDGISHSGKQSGPPSLGNFSNPNVRLAGAKNRNLEEENGIFTNNGDDISDTGDPFLDVLKRNSEDLRATHEDNSSDWWQDKDKEGLSHVDYVEAMRQIICGTDLDAAAKLAAELSSKSFLATESGMEDKISTTLALVGVFYFYRIKDKKGNVVAYARMMADGSKEGRVMMVDWDGQLCDVLREENGVAIAGRMVATEVADVNLAWLRLISGFQKGMVKVEFGGGCYAAFLFTGLNGKGDYTFAGFYLDASGNVKSTYGAQLIDKLAERPINWYNGRYGKWGDDDDEKEDDRYDEDGTDLLYMPLIIVNPNPYGEYESPIK